MALNVTVTFGTLTNPFDFQAIVAFVRSTTVSISGSISGADIASNTINTTHITPGAYFYAAGALAGSSYAVTLSPALAGLANGVVVRFKASAESPAGGCTLNVNSLGAKNLYRNGVLVLGKGSIRADQLVECIYNTSLNAAAGGWEITSQHGHTEDHYQSAVTTGTNDYVATFSPTVRELVDGLKVRFKVPNTSTGACTFAPDSLAAKAIKKNHTVACESGDLVAGEIREMTYDSTTDAWLLAPLVDRDAAVVASSRGLLIVNNTGSPATSIDIDADEIVLKAAAKSMVASTVNLTVAITSNGANGLDTGAEGSSTWYYLWVIHDPATGTTAGLLSTSATSPTMPAGYTFKALVGAVYNDSGSDFDTIYQRDRRVWIQGIKALDDGTGQTSYASLSLSAIVPPTARSVYGTGGATAAVNVNMAVAADANGLGEHLCHGSNITALGADAGAPGLPTFTGGSSFHVPLKTAQAIYWKTHNTTANSYGIVISGYTI